MILILSGDGDLSTDIVIKSLKKENYPYVRLNAYDLLKPTFKIQLANNLVTISCDGYTINTAEIRAVWHRKFGFFKNSLTYRKAVDAFGYQNALELSREFTTLLESVISVFKDKKWLTNPYYISLNKLQVLSLALKQGLNIPESYVIAEKEELRLLLNEKSIITKSIRDSWILRDENNAYTMFTSEIKNEDTKYLPETFFPSLIQQKIEKSYEVRSFYLLGKFYSMAIFSQNDHQTSLDFRRYNWEKPNRVTPYKLPIMIEKKLRKLIRIVNLNCCSVDLIKGLDDNYYFLEINPTGQFGMVDFPCNYGLHEKLAQALIKMDKTDIKKHESIFA